MKNNRFLKGVKVFFITFLAFIGMQEKERGGRGTTSLSDIYGVYSGYVRRERVAVVGLFSFGVALIVLPFILDLGILWRILSIVAGAWIEVVVAVMWFIKKIVEYLGDLSE